MKKKLYRTALMAMACLASSAAFAYDAQVGGIYYNFHGNEAEVTYFDTSSDNAEAYTDHFSIPSHVEYEGKTYTVTAIGDRAFAGCDELRYFDEFPETIKRIGDYAFHGCSKLDYFAFPFDSRVTSIGEDAFSECSALTSISLPEGLMTMGEYAFQHCTALSYVSLPGSLKSISYGAFRFCSSLNDVDFEEGLETIGEEAFALCSSLTDITLPASLTSIGEIAFDQCEALEYVTFNGETPHMGDYAFSGTVWMDNLRKDDSNIEGGIFYFFNTAYEVVDPSITTLSLRPGTTAIAPLAFAGHEGLTDVVIPEGVESIGEMAFAQCLNVCSVVLPASVRKIGEAAFAANLKLSAITVDAANEAYVVVDGVLFDKAMTHLMQYPAAKTATSYAVPEGVETIDFYAMAFNPYLADVRLPHSLTEIRSAAFDGCTALTSIAFPENMESIGEAAFEGCSAITDVYSLAVEPPYLDSYAFDSPKSLTLHVVSALFDAYTKAPVWEDFRMGDSMTPCAVPTISVENGELVFDCTTPGAEYVYSFAAKGGAGTRAVVPSTLTVTVKAVAPGYGISDNAEYTFSIAAGDTNRDGTLSISDVSKLVNKLLGK